MYERGVNGTLGESRCLGDCSHTGADRSPFVSRSLTVEVQVNHERRRLLIMPDQISHQDVENVIVNWNDFAKSRHGNSCIDFIDKQTGATTPAKTRKPLRITPKRLSTCLSGYSDFAIS
jgi:hypothetical protein